MRGLGRAAAIIALALLAACGGYGSDIDAVKQAEATPGGLLAPSSRTTASVVAPT